MCYFKNWLFFVLLVWPCFAPELGLRSFRAIGLFFDLSPTIQTVLSNKPQSNIKTAQQQHQTPSHRESHSTTERGQSVVALSTRTRLLIDCIFFIQFISPFAQIFKKKRYERDTFGKLNRDTDSPTPLMLEYWNSDTDNTKYVLLMEITQSMCYYAL